MMHNDNNDIVYGECYVNQAKQQNIWFPTIPFLKSCQAKGRIGHVSCVMNANENSRFLHIPTQL